MSHCTLKLGALHACNPGRSGNGVAARQPFPRKSLWNARVTHPVPLHMILALDRRDSRYCQLRTG
jgi:hypothetical protein